jgi:hypothetical protein
MGSGIQINEGYFAKVKNLLLNHENRGNYT